MKSICFCYNSLHFLWSLSQPCLWKKASDQYFVCRRPVICLRYQFVANIVGLVLVPIITVLTSARAYFYLSNSFNPILNSSVQRFYTCIIGWNYPKMIITCIDNIVQFCNTVIIVYCLWLIARQIQFNIFISFDVG